MNPHGSQNSELKPRIPSRSGAISGSTGLLLKRGARSLAILTRARSPLASPRLAELTSGTSRDRRPGAGSGSMRRVRDDRRDEMRPVASGKVVSQLLARRGEHSRHLADDMLGLHVDQSPQRVRMLKSTMKRRIASSRCSPLRPGVAPDPVLYLSLVETEGFEAALLRPRKYRYSVGRETPAFACHLRQREPVVPVPAEHPQASQTGSAPAWSVRGPRSSLYSNAADL